MSLQTRALIKNEVLAAIEREKSHVIRGHLRELATALAEYLLDEDNNEGINKPLRLLTHLGDERWNELLPWILKMIDSKNEGLMEAGFLMLGQLTLYLEEWLANPLTNFTAATAVVNVGLQHPDLKVKSLGRVANCLRLHKRPSPLSIHLFSTLLEPSSLNKS